MDQLVPEWQPPTATQVWYQHVDAFSVLPDDFLDLKDDPPEEDECPGNDSSIETSGGVSEEVVNEEPPESPPSDNNPPLLNHWGNERQTVYICRPEKSGESLLQRKRFMCEICDKTFSHRSGLSRHRATHYGWKHMCAKCPQTFTRSDSLSDHVRRVHFI